MNKLVNTFLFFISLSGIAVGIFLLGKELPVILQEPVATNHNDDIPDIERFWKKFSKILDGQSYINLRKKAEALTKKYSKALPYKESNRSILTAGLVKWNSWRFFYKNILLKNKPSNTVKKSFDNRKKAFVDLKEDVKAEVRRWRTIGGTVEEAIKILNDRLKAREEKVFWKKLGTPYWNNFKRTLNHYWRIPTTAIKIGQKAYNIKEIWKIRTDPHDNFYQFTNIPAARKELFTLLTDNINVQEVKWELDQAKMYQELQEIVFNGVIPNVFKYQVATINGQFYNLQKINQEKKLAFIDLNEAKTVIEQLLTDGITPTQVRQIVKNLTKKIKTDLWKTLKASKNLLIQFLTKDQSNRVITIGDNNYYGQLETFTEFIKKADNADKEFTDLTAEEQELFIDDFFDNGISGADIKTALLAYKNNFIAYWNGLKAKLNAFEHLQTNYNLTRLMINGKDYFSNLQELIGVKTAEISGVVGSPRTSLGRLFIDGISVTKIDAVLKRLANEEKTKLWNFLKNNKEWLISITAINSNIPILIQNTNYREILTRFVNFIGDINADSGVENANKDFATITGQEKNDIDQLFTEGITTQKLIVDLNKYTQIQLPFYWRALKQKLEAYQSIINKYNPTSFVINSRNYLGKLNKLAISKETSFTALDSVKQKYIETLFKNGVTINTFDNQMSAVVAAKIKENLRVALYKQIPSLTNLIIKHKYHDAIVIGGTDYQVEVEDLIKSLEKWDDFGGGSTVVSNNKIKQLIEHFFRNNLKVATLESDLINHRKQKLISYWSDLNAWLTTHQRFIDVYQPQQIVIEKINRLNALKALAQVKNVAFATLETSSKQQLTTLFDDGVGIIKLNAEITQWKTVAKEELWNQLKTKKQSLLNLLYKHRFSDAINIKGSNYRSQLVAFLTFISQENNKDKNFNQLQPQEKATLVNPYLNMAITATNLGMAIDNYRTTKLGTYWTQLQARMDACQKFIKNYQSQSFNIDGVNFINELEELAEVKDVAFEHLGHNEKTQLVTLFNRGVTITQLDAELTKLQEKIESESNFKTPVKKVNKNNSLPISLAIGGGVLVVFSLIGFGYWLIRKQRIES